MVLGCLVKIDRIKVTGTRYLFKVYSLNVHYQSQEAIQNVSVWERKVLVEIFQVATFRV